MSDCAEFLPPYYSDELVTVLHGDCLDVLPSLADASVDAVVCDPPYRLGFMGKAWDSTDVAFDPETWRLVSRVLKPGGHLLAFGGTRTYHRLACAVEDAGFEIRDSISWLYGSGFPKSLDVSKVIDRAAGAERDPGTPRVRLGDAKPYPYNTEDYDGAIIGERGKRLLTQPATDAAREWSGWGTALKPAHEPIVVGRKSLVGTVAANVAEHGTGALNIDGCRVGSTVETWPISRAYSRHDTGNAIKEAAQPTGDAPAGRWPTNVVIDESQAAALDEQTGVLTSGANPTRRGSDKFRTAYGDFTGQAECTPARGVDQGGASRFFPTFRYEAKAPTHERPNVDGVLHPTVKPLDLMRWLVRLVTPRGGTVLDPFLGSGTTAEACVLEGLHCIGIEREADYLPLIRARLTKPLHVGLDFGQPA